MKASTYHICTLLLTILLSVAFPGLIASAENENPPFLSVTGPCRLQFPEDHAPHPGYRTEWWYYTGNLTADWGAHFGFQLTFFRTQISPSHQEEAPPAVKSA